MKAVQQKHPGLESACANEDPDSLCDIVQQMLARCVYRKLLLKAAH